MILNAPKCHFLISTPEVAEQMFIKVGGQIIWESLSEILLGVSIDKQLKFEGHIENICKLASRKLSALARMAKLASFDQ